MPETVGQHGVAAFTNPSNGDPLDATVVKGNDNTLRTAYVAHDDDTGIHVQSSLLASRPAAGTAGRKWLTTDSGDVRLWYDTGSVWVEVAYVRSGVSVTLAGLTLTGPLAMGDNLIERPVIKDYGETRTTPSISAGTLTLNLENGNVFGVALNANITTLTIQNPSASGTACSFTLAFTADGTPRTVTWGASVKWAGGTAPTLTSTNTKVDIFTFVTWDAGTTWYGFVSGQNF
jgi:hypothetical protein